MFLCVYISKDIQFITMLETVKDLLKEVGGFVPKSEKEVEDFRLKLIDGLFKEILMEPIDILLSVNLSNQCIGTMVSTKNS